MDYDLFAPPLFSPPMNAMVRENILQVANRLCANKELNALNLGIFENFQMGVPFVDHREESEENEVMKEEEIECGYERDEGGQEYSASTPSTSSTETAPTSTVTDYANNNQQLMAGVQMLHEINTANSMLPVNSQSPWMRNAGRKKSHPVWDFFKDLKGSVPEGTGGVVCLHCDWAGDDRSPNNLRTHLKKFHTADGIFQRFSEKLAMTPTQPYVKRARAGGNSQSSTPTLADNMTLALQNALQANFQQQQSKMEESDPVLRGHTFSFLDSIPKMNEVINITAGFNQHNNEDNDCDQHENSVEPGSSGVSVVETDPHRVPSTSPPVDTSSSSEGNPAGGSPSVSSTNHINTFLSMAANPLMYMNAVSALAGQAAAAQQQQQQQQNNLSSLGSAFTLNDGQCVSMLMKMALDLDLTMSYHRRRGDIELCFESNRTAEKSGGRGKVLSMCDVGREIRITERVNGNPTDSELWTKTDFNQFHWAIRGKCQKVLLK